MAVKYLSGNRLWGTSSELFNMNIPDSVGTSGDGVITGSVTSGTAKLGTASLDFQGSSDYVTISPSGMSWTDLTLAGWMKTDSITTIGYFAIVDSTAGQSHFYISGSSSSYLRCEGKWGTVNASSGTWSNATWYHVALVVEGSTIKTYQNGSLIGSGTPISTLGSVSAITLGGDVGVGSYWLDGLMDDVGFWEKALTADQISALYNGGTGKQIKDIASLSDGLNIYYDCDSVSGGVTNNIGTATSPNLPNGSIFITSDTNEHFMWNSSAETWNEVA